MGSSLSGRYRTVTECKRTTVFQQFTYRIPSLLRLPEGGDLLAFAEKRATASDTDALWLVMRRGQVSHDSVQWLPMQELQDATLPGHRAMNPCPVYERDSGTLFLFFICVPTKMSESHQIRTRKNAARLCYVMSTNQGQNWSAVADLTERVIGEREKYWATFAVGPGHGIQTASGNLIIPAYAYHIDSWCLRVPCPWTVQPHAFYYYSTDRGKTWLVGHTVHRKSCECEMAEVVDHEGKGHMYCNARNRGFRRVEALAETNSTGFGKSGLAPKLVEQHHGCQGSVIGFPAPKPYLEKHSKESTKPTDSLTWLLFSHPTDRRRRRNLGVYLNKRPLQGSNWEEPWIINRGPSGYSDLVYCEDKELFVCLMECGEKSEVEQIASMCFSLSDVLETTGKKAEIQ
uniref:exo-alpha-sialidase n=1 Tax=Scleropages formosus TaxID=113540 RepID=A0A8C9VW31_SCLFO